MKPQLPHYLLLIYRIAVLYVLLTITRVVFYTFNASLFPEVSFGEFLTILRGGLKFDTTAIIYLNFVFIVMMILPFRFTFHAVYQKIAKWLYIVTNSFGLLANVSDTVYYQFTVKRTTSLVFSQFSNEENMLPLIGKFMIDWWYMTLFFIALVALLVFLYDRFRLKEPTKNNLRFYGFSVVGMCCFFVMAAFGADFDIAPDLFHLPTRANM